MTRAGQMRQAIKTLGGTATNHGNPKEIKFTMPSGTTLDEVTESIADVPGFVIRKDKSHFKAVDISK